MVVAGRERARDHVDAFGNRVTRRERVHRGLLTERVDDLGHAVAVAVGQQHLDDARGVDQLAGGTRADGADTGDEDSHRNSGASSSRQPPLVGGTPPLPRKRAIKPDEAGQAEDEEHAAEGLHSAGLYRAASAFGFGPAAHAVLLRSTPSRGYSSVG